LIINNKGKVAENFYVLGASEMPIYLLDGEKPALFEASLSVLGPVLVEEIRRILGNHPPEMLFLTHVHFDHCGSAAYLKKAFPKLKIAASRKAAEILTRPNALSLMALLNQSAAEVIKSWHPEITGTAVFEPFQLDRVLADGDRIELGPGSTVEVIAAPGHTWDSLSYYLPERKILIASEAAGCVDNTGEVVTEFLADYRAYVDTIHRLSRLDVDIFCQGHRLVYTGTDVPSFFERSLEAAAIFRETVEKILLEEGGDISRTVARIKAQEYDPLPHPKQPEPAYLINLEARVKHLALKMNEG
jgi:glyoxylase-like metal-dependent hydrolase (beta-lactamase superfamily II)